MDGFDYTSQNPLALQCTGCPAAAARPDIAGNRPDGGADLANMKGGVVFADGGVYNADREQLRAARRRDLPVDRADAASRRLRQDVPERRCRIAARQAGNTRATAYNPSINNNLTPASNLSQTLGLLYPIGLLPPLKNSQGLATNNGTGVSFHIDDRKIQEFHQYSAETQYQLPWRSVVTHGLRRQPHEQAADQRSS